MKPVERTSPETYIRKVSSLYWRNNSAERFVGKEIVL